jgi:two-component system LytT family response regulator
MNRAVKSSKINVLIVDDEPLARKFIRRLLKDDQEVAIVAECRNGYEAITKITQGFVDLVFLDVQMPEMDGFGVLETLGDIPLPQIVFTTAYDQYAIRAFEVHALDYLLKPFDQARFRQVMDHAKSQLPAAIRKNQRTQISTLLDNQSSPYLNRLIVKTSGRIIFLKTEEIRWIEAADKYVQLHTGKTTRLVRQTLNAIELQLDPNRFIRIHRSAIVNIEHIQELQPLIGGEYRVVLSDGTKLTLSRNYRNKLLA